MLSRIICIPQSPFLFRDIFFCTTSPHGMIHWYTLGSLSPFSFWQASPLSCILTIVDCYWCSGQARNGNIRAEMAVLGGGNMGETSCHWYRTRKYLYCQLFDMIQYWQIYYFYWLCWTQQNCIRVLYLGFCVGWHPMFQCYNVTFHHWHHTAYTSCQYVTSQQIITLNHCCNNDPLDCS